MSAATLPRHLADILTYFDADFDTFCALSEDSEGVANWLQPIVNDKAHPKHYDAFAVWAQLNNEGAAYRSLLQERIDWHRANEEAQRVLSVERSQFAAFDPGDVVSIFDLPDSDEGDWLIEGVLPRFGTTMLYAEGFAGKSYLALGWAASVATGTPWFSKPVAQSKVLYVAMEGRASVKKRVRAWAIENGVSENALSAGLMLYPRAVNMVDKEAVSALAHYVEDNGYSLVIIDTLAKSLGSADATKDAGALLQGYEQVREATGDGGLLFVHHTKKENRRLYRDSSRYFDDVDQAWLFTLGEADTPANPLRILECTKNKFDASDSQKYNLEFASAGPDSVLRMTDIPEASDVVRHIKKTLDAADAPMTKAELFESYKGSKSESTFGNHLSTLCKSGNVTKHSGKTPTYQLS